nr:Autophagy-related protein 18H [Ipomoea batatas]
MKKNQSINSNSNVNTKVKNGATNGFLPNSFKFISSCIKTVSSNVRCAGASVAGSISAAASDSDDHRKDQVLWACFDKLHLGPSFKHVLLIGYSNGFQVLDVEDASNVCELVSRRDDPVTFLQMQPIPAKSDGHEGYINSHPMLLVVACDETAESIPAQSGRDGFIEPQAVNLVNSPTTLRFYSLRSHNYVHSLRFRSTIFMVRSSPQIVAVGLATQIYCFDALTLENKLCVLTYPVPQLGGQGFTGVNIGYGPMAVGPRWLAYSSNNPMISNTGRLSPQSLSPSPGVSPSTSPGNGNLVARYAMESSKQLASGLINLGDMGYKTLSKYCHELLPDGSGSPISSSSGWKVGRGPIHLSETDAAGMVVIKDFISRAVVSQFRAHKSPISVLCFDPSGTLLVTASIRGNNINIFRIMPSSSQNGSGVHSNDWSSSHVHLYKLHRGVTPAVIQDICFSYYSQWVAIISTRGTCHIFVLSPFGGETGLQLQNTHVNDTMLIPILSLPWWSASSFSINQQSSTPPPAPITLSVVSRIKNVSGWLNTVSNAASSVAGKVSVPSGVVAAVFHSCIHQDVQRAPQNVNSLEHLLAFTPSGHLIQYEMVPSLGGEQGDTTLRTGTGPLVHMQEDELRVKAEPVQWWDVCRRADWPEREECVKEIAFGTHGGMDTVIDTSVSEDDGIGGKDISVPHNQAHWYLSNAEVQSRSWRIPIWQKSKICFYTMSLQGSAEQYIEQLLASREIEIENVPVNEVEIKRKDLLPVFDQFQRIQTNWDDERISFDGRFSGSSYGSSSGKEKSEDTASNAKAAALCAVKKSHADEMNITPVAYPQIDLMDENDGARESGFSGPLMPNRTFSIPELSTNIISSLEEGYIVNSPSPPKSGSLSAGETSARDIQSSNSALTSQASNTSSNHSDMSMNISNDEGLIHEDMSDPVDFAQYFKEGYCKASTNKESSELTKLVTDIDRGNNPCEKEKGEDDDGESDDMLGGVFDFSEEVVELSQPDVMHGAYDLKCGLLLSKRTKMLLTGVLSVTFT